MIFGANSHEIRGKLVEHSGVAAWRIKFDTSSKNVVNFATFSSRWEKKNGLAMR